MYMFRQLSLDDLPGPRQPNTISLVIDGFNEHINLIIWLGIQLLLCVYLTSFKALTAETKAAAPTLRLFPFYL